jgi:crossover junction endodeoxyribonuclease RusA
VKWELTYTQRPVSLNASYGHTRFERTAHVIEWRQAFWALAKEQRLPRLDRIAVTVVTRLHGRMQDIGNNYVSAKAAIDGLVQANVIPDDTGDHLTALTFLPPERVPATTPCSLTLIIETEQERNP